MFGKIEFDNFEGMTKMPQKAATAWAGLSEGLVGASYKPLVYIGSQVSKGINYWFIAEQTIITNPPAKRIVTLAINEFNGIYTIIPASIQVIFS